MEDKFKFNQERVTEIKNHIANNLLQLGIYQSVKKTWHWKITITDLATECELEVWNGIGEDREDVIAGGLFQLAGLMADHSENARELNA